MTRSVRNILLAFVVALIVIAIAYLESKKVHGIASSADVVPVVATTTARTNDFAERKAAYPASKELVAPDGYINTPSTNSTDSSQASGGQASPITLQSLVGKKVVLLDFWTYSCINCLRVIPYLNAWYAKYKNAGLEIIGVHTPEFAFEKNYDNVVAAVQKFGIQYPVILDNENRTWNTYGNMYWPEHYLIDINGFVVDRHIGEGGYAETEKKIQQLLTERKEVLKDPVAIPTGIVDITQAVQTNSPETYFGAARNEFLANGTLFVTGMQSLSRPTEDHITLNKLNVVGMWNFNAEYAENSSADARIIYKYQSMHVYFVASSKSGVQITVLRDGVPVVAEKGDDVDASGHVLIKGARLYKLINESDMNVHTIEIIIDKPGLDAYTFTFG